MRRFIHLYLVSLIVLLGSCRSFKNVTAKDVSGSEQSKKKNNSNDVTFLDNVSITPGSKQIISAEVSSTKKTYALSSNSSNKNGDIENASKVQLKYAVMLDVPVEELTNTLLLDAIDHWWGTKYCLGGSTENCTDCSAFTQNLMRDVYATGIPRTAQEQYNNSTHIKTKELQQGDLVFFQNSKHNISHVGLYIANNKFVHASVSNGVTISDLNENYWKERYKGAGTMFK
ncbi:MAG TPA: C40 family peptidase [Chitinophagaceae bacterium]